MRRRFVSPALLAVALAAPAIASDGVIEINQAKVVASGGFPYTLAVSGSYRLTSNLELSGPNAADTGVLIISAPFVTLDLNGFGLVGPAICGDNCTNTGTGDGITIQNVASASIRNGFVKGMGDKGIVVAPGYARVEQVEVIDNGGNGFEISEGYVLSSVARKNGGYGIVGGNLAISDSVALKNLTGGIWTLGAAIVAHCTVDPAPSVFGVKLSGGGSLLDSNVRAEGTPAVVCDGACTIGGNTFGNCANLAACVTGTAPIQIHPNVCGSALCAP